MIHLTTEQLMITGFVAATLIHSLPPPDSSSGKLYVYFYKVTNSLLGDWQTLFAKSSTLQAQGNIYNAAKKDS